MVAADGERGAGARIDLFISYTPADERWATWIAWQLEAAGYTTLLQAWDFVPGTNFIELMDRGLRTATAVVAVLSHNYQRSRFGQLEWQTALRSDPENRSSRLITVRVEDLPLEGLLSTITYVDLVGIDDPGVARDLLLTRIRQALAGRARPSAEPTFPAGGTGAGRAPAGESDGDGAHPGFDPPTTFGAGRTAQPTSSFRSNRPGRPPVEPPIYPPSEPPPGVRTEVTILHVDGPRFGRGLAEPGVPTTAEDLQAQIWADLTQLRASGAPSPDLLVVTGDLTESGSVREFAEATSFLNGLRVLLSLEPQRVVVVPGGHDITRKASEAYFSDCGADDIPPKLPYWPKWRHYSRMFGDLYSGLDDLTFDSQQPWTLWALPDLHVAVAGINSTIADSHRDEDHYGWIGTPQAAWFARQLEKYEESGWLRIGVMRHVPSTESGPPPAPADAREALRDGAGFDRLVAPHLNLLLHGAPHRRARRAANLVGETASGLTIVPALADRHQLVTVDASGLRRWPGQLERDQIQSRDRGSRPTSTTAPPERIERRWQQVGAAFPPPVEVEGHASTGSTGVDGTTRPELDPRRDQLGPRVESTPASPAEQLLERIAEVCEARYDRPRMRRGPGEPPTLWITYRGDGLIRQQLVAAHVGPVTREALEEFLANVHASDPDVPAELVYSGPPAAPSLRDEAWRRGVGLRSFLEFQGLLDLRHYVERQTRQLTHSALYPPSLYVTQRFRNVGGTDRAVHTGLVEELLRLISADDGRFVLVLGDFGRGKTFALREVARRIPAELPHLVPVFIELRALDKAHSVEGLVAAHLAGYDEDLPLKAFRYMLREGRIVLLFDGFDELASRVTYDRAAEHLDTLLQAVEDRAKVIVSSRTQHFRTDAQVLTALGERVGQLPHRRVLAIEEFSPPEVRAYLTNRYRGDEAAAASRYELIDRADLLALCQNPRMLCFVADLETDRLRGLVLGRNVVSTAQLYEAVLGSWMDYELRRVADMGGAPTSLDHDDLWHAVTLLALRLYGSSETFLRLDAIAEAAETLAALAERPLTTDETVHAIGTGSLLVRTDDGLFGFIHRSVVEWLVAKDIARGLELDPGNGDSADNGDSGDGGDGGDGGSPPAAGPRPTGRVAQAGPAVLERHVLSQLTVDFLCDLADPRALRAWCRKTIEDTGAADIARRNALKLDDRLRTAARGDWSEANLAGEDLSHRDLAGANFAGADLSNAQLVSTDLSGARLRGARLVGANLDEASLVDADLRDANLGRARLFRTDLRGAQLDGSRWRRAALVATSHDDAVDTAPELRGAAIAPGHRVDMELAPAVVSSSYGFEIGRIPQPVAFVADGSAVAIGADDGGVLLYDVTSGLPVRTLRGHEGRVYAAVCPSADRPLATGAADATIRVWDQVTGELRHVLRGHRDWVWPVQVSPDGRMVAVGDSSGTVRLWDTATGEVAAELGGHAMRVWNARFTRDSHLLATADADGVIRLWDTAGDPPSGALLAELVAPGRDGRSGRPGHSVFRLRFDHDGTRLASAHEGGLMVVWDVAARALRHELAGHESSVYTLDWHPSGKSLASGDIHGVVRLWNPLSGETTSLERQSGAVYHVKFDPTGEVLATGDSDGVIRLWDGHTGDLRHELLGHKSSVWPMAFSPDGRLLASASNDDSTRLWSVATGQCRHVLAGHRRRVTSVRFNADSSLMATSSSDGIVRLWDPATAQCRELTGGPVQLLSAVFSSVGPQLATIANDGKVYVWHPDQAEYVRAVDVETEHIWAAAFSPDGDVLATANDDDTVQLRYGSTGRLIAVLGEHRGRVRSIEFHLTEPVLATGCDDRAVRIWDVRGGQCVATLRGHGDRVYAVLFSPTGDLLASASNDGRARLWDWRSGEQVRELGSPRYPLWSAAFSPDGHWLASAGDDGVVSLWDTETGEIGHRLRGHTQRIRSVSFSPDGSHLASASDDGTVRLWGLAGDAPHLRLTLVGVPGGWGAVAPDGRYKAHGAAAGAFWHAIGTRRFEPGELDQHLPDVNRLPLAAPF